MDVVSFVKQLMCDNNNNVTLKSLFYGSFATFIVGTLIYAFFYLPYSLIYHGNDEATMFLILMGIIGIISWGVFTIIIIEKCKRMFNKYGDKVLFTWK